ncbi:MAG TPA: DEAD/DEAH box helicase [Rudaea sp.]|jgi:ATP-dependent Lhr-like helicase|uniref:DEAD/DEAH box helicase n=1 Tax=Rudaea sp. TaxID=2136325 RepID=UPI002F9483F2
MPLEYFHPAVAAWFRETFPAPTPAQTRAWPAIQSGRNVLIAAPTGSGKTLAAFMAAIDDLVRRGVEGTLTDETAVVYVSPLKALSNDVRINLQVPLEGIRAQLEKYNLPDVEIRTFVRTGDTPQAERTQMRKRPPHIVVTTPESLYILLGSESGRAMLATTRTVIVDEIHALAPSKRGAHLALSLERLEALSGRRLTRIGLSATQKPIGEVAKFLVGKSSISDEHSQNFPPSAPRAPSPATQGKEKAETSHLGILPLRSGGRWRQPEGGALDNHCDIIDVGYARARDLALELPPAPLSAVMSGDVWQLVYARLAELIQQHRTTLIFVNTRRMAERLARHLSELLGKDAVTSHHGSLAREQRLAAEQRLKRGELRALVATASLELGIDIGDVDLVCQIASPRSISTFLQRVGRANHSVDGLPKGRLFPLSRDDLVECAALLDAVRRGELDTLHVERDALDVLAQQIVAEVACREWNESELFELIRRAEPFANLSADTFREILRMLADGYATRRGPRSAYLHRDAVNGLLRARRGARLTAITSGGAIPDTADYEVVLEPAAQKIGTVHEDFAVESMAGDIFQLGNTAYRVLRVERGKLRVEDAQGLPPTIPFWLGEAPGRSDELSFAVSRLREELSLLLEPDSIAAEVWLREKVGLNESAARQIVDYLGATKAALGLLPTQKQLAMERFFDESGGTQLVIHSPFGSRLNRAWGLALRKRFCRTFNFELQAAATEDAIVLSLSTSHSFPLDDVARYLHSNSAEQVLIQALLDAPMFGLRWRWNAVTSLALPRFVGGAKVPPQLQRMKSEDLLATVFPDQVACQENIVGERQIPEHPLVAQTLHDCLHQAMDIDGLLHLLKMLESGEIHIVARDLTAPSPLAAEILNARPYAFLDDAPLEERRTQAVQSRRWGDIESTDDFGKLDIEAIDGVREEAWPEARNADELHEALMGLGFVTDAEMRANPSWRQMLDQLIAQRRTTRFQLSPLPSGEVGARSATGEGPASDYNPSLEFTSGRHPVFPSAAVAASTSSGAFRHLLPVGEGKSICIPAERLPQFAAIFPEHHCEPAISAPEEYSAIEWTYEDALVDIVRARLTGLGPARATDIAASLNLPPAYIDLALSKLESEGFVMRGRFTPGAQDTEWCERHLLARIHRYTVKRLRREIEPVEPRDFMRFLFEWQRVAPGAQVSGPDALAGVLAQLEGFEAPAAAWESEILPARVSGYEISWLDDLCLAGRIVWTRLRAPATRPDEADAARPRTSAGPVRATPIVLLQRRNIGAWTQLGNNAQNAAPSLSSRAQAVADHLREYGASFFDELAGSTRLLHTELEDALAELVAVGMINSDSFAGLRALLVPSSRRPSPHRRRGRRTALLGIADAGRWALLRRTAPTPVASKKPHGIDVEIVEQVARTLLKRYGVICWRLVAHEAQWLPPWRELLRVCHRLEACGEIRGGRFIAGISGEQFALPEAIAPLRAVRQKPRDGTLISVCGSDPLNLVGHIVAGAKLPNLAGARVLYRDGMPIATLAAGEFTAIEPMDESAHWAARKRLLHTEIEAAAIDT